MSAVGKTSQDWDAIKQHQAVDHLHLSDVLIALWDAGYTVDRKKGLIIRREEEIL